MRDQGFTRLAPGGSAISARALRRLLRERQPEEVLRRGLRDRLAGRTVTLHASGREALRVAFHSLAASTGRSEIAIPAYACFSIPAAAVAAGLRVRLVDVDEAGRVDEVALEHHPFDNVAALVVANLFGVPEPVAGLAKRAHGAGVRLIDDAAQALGALSATGPVGARGDLGVLSFGRGKPLSALGGGALVWGDPPEPGDRMADALEPPRRWTALLRAAAYDFARNPIVLRALSAIPALGIGTTVYDPGFARGPMPGAAIALAAAQLPELEITNERRARRATALAARLREETDSIPLLAAPGETGIYPRLGVLAATPARREAAVTALAHLGATGMYPTCLDAVPGLQPHLVAGPDCPGAHDFCARLFTLPTHAGLRNRHVDQIVRILRES